MNMSRSLFVIAIVTCVSVSGCDKNQKPSDSPDGVELPPEREVADKTSKPKPGNAAQPKPKPDEKVAAAKVVEPTKPAVTPPQDRDQNAEKAKMKRSREKSGKAKQLLRAGSYDKAITQAREALRDHEQNVEAMLVIAECFYKQGKHELVLSVTSSILKVDPKVLSPEEKSQAYNLMAFGYLQAGKRGDAFNSFKSAAETDEHNASAWNNLGVQYMWRGETATAETCFAYAVSLDAKFPEAVLNHGAALRANGKLSEAEAAYRDVVKQRPDWAEVHFNLGVLYLDAEQIPNHDEIAKLNAAVKEFETYKSLVAKGSTSVERSKTQQGPTDAMGNELVSIAQADLYIKSANKSLESEQRRQERDAKRKAKEEGEKAPATTETEPEAEPAETPPGPAQPQEPGKPQKPGEQPSAPAPSQPSPSQPAPTQPTPAQPSKPAPAQPTPVQPSKPAPTQPSQPAPAQPKPAQPSQPPPSQPPATQPSQPPAQPSQPPPSSPTQKPQSPSKPQSPTQKPPQPQQPGPQKPQKPAG